MMGEVPTSRRKLPSPLPEVEFKPETTGSTECSIDEIINRALDTYKAFGHYRKACDRYAREHDEWNSQLILFARMLRAAGLSPEHYVQFIFSKMKHVPFPQQVFGTTAVRAWLPEYMRRSTLVVRNQNYAQTGERQREHEERIASARTLRVPR